MLYVALVNNDVVLDPQWLNTLVISLDRVDRDVGGVVGKILQLRNPGYINSAGDFVGRKHNDFVSRGYGCKDAGQFDEEGEVFSVTAAACVYRREMLEDVGMAGEFLDEDFFAYYEDVDLCLRARWLGWKFYFDSKAVAYHYGSATSNLMSGRRVFLLWRNRNWLALKNLPFPEIIGVLLKYMHLLFLHLGYNLLKRKPLVLWYIIKGYVVSFGGIPKMWSKRRHVQQTKNISNMELMRWFKSQSLS